MFFMFAYTGNRHVNMISRPDVWVTIQSHAGNGVHPISMLIHAAAWNVIILELRGQGCCRKVLVTLCQLVSFSKSLS